MIRRKLHKEIIEKHEFQIWNSFIDILAMEDENNLTDIQKHAQRAFWYESEVQNGGHGQYFENIKYENYCNIIKSIEIIGAIEHSKLLNEVVENYLPIIDDINIDINVIGKIGMDYDFRYGSIKPDMNYYLKNYFYNNINEFIEII
jgi:hypothetical protein